MTPPPSLARSLVSGFKCKFRESNKRPPYSRLRAQTTRLYTIHKIQLRLSIIITLVLGAGKNETIADISEEALGLCGVNYCPGVEPYTAEESEEAALAEAEENENFAIGRTKIYVLAGIYLVCSLLSAVVIVFLVDPLSR